MPQKPSSRNGKGDANEPVVVKKYANRRLYNTSTSTYVTLEDLSDMVKEGVDFVVYDAKSGDDITRAVLTQIIFEQESRGQNLLPVQFLRRLIRFYGDSLQAFVPSYLEMSMEAFAKQRERMQDRFSDSWSAGTMDAFHDQARKNMELFDHAMRMFTPFRSADDADLPEGVSANPTAETASANAVEALRKEMTAMQAKLDALTTQADTKKSPSK